MAYNENLADGIRTELSVVHKVEEKKMMGELTFMVNGKMCVGVASDDLMVRLAPEEYEKALERKGCGEMDFTGKPMRGFVFVNNEGTKTKKDLEYWIDLAVAYNKKPKAPKKAQSKKA